MEAWAPPIRSNHWVKRKLNISRYGLKAKQKNKTKKRLQTWPHFKLECIDMFMSAQIQKGPFSPEPPTITGSMADFTWASNPSPGWQPFLQIYFPRISLPREREVGAPCEARVESFATPSTRKGNLLARAAPLLPVLLTLAPLCRLSSVHLGRYPETSLLQSPVSSV